MADAFDVKLELKYSLRTADSVLAVAPFRKSSLVYSTTNKVHMASLHSHTDDLVPVGEVVLRSAVVHLTCDDDTIYASTMSHSIVVIKYQAGSLVVTESDPMARKMIHHVQYRPQYVLGTDKDRTIVCLQSHNERKHFQNMSIVFQCTLPTMLSRLGVGKFLPARESHDTETPIDTAASMRYADLNMPRELDPQPDFEDVVIGVGINGSTYGFRILSEREHTILCAYFDHLIHEISKRFRMRRRKAIRKSVPKSIIEVLYPLELGLISRAFQVSGVLVSEPVNSVPETNETVKAPYTSSARHIDGDVLAYMHDLMAEIDDDRTFIGSAGSVGSASSSGASSISSNSSMSSTSSSSSASSSANQSRTSFVSPQTKEWLDLMLNGISL
ncbi:uncharacterized protein V1518DRAFT_378800 [Limtongia smithiae]|uniref:uncharacterized protein n=1 Tax=Limtongia smithiae TaxID=1125753 RepID=UPI0034CEC4E0